MTVVWLSDHEPLFLYGDRQAVPVIHYGYYTLTHTYSAVLGATRQGGGRSRQRRQIQLVRIIRGGTGTRRPYRTPPPPPRGPLGRKWNLGKWIRALRCIQIPIATS